MKIHISYSEQYGILEIEVKLNSKDIKISDNGKLESTEGQIYKGIFNQIVADNQKTATVRFLWNHNQDGYGNLYRFSLRGEQKIQQESLMKVITELGCWRGIEVVLDDNVKQKFGITKEMQIPGECLSYAKIYDKTREHVRKLLAEKSVGINFNDVAKVGNYAGLADRAFYDTSYTCDVARPDVVDNSKYFKLHIAINDSDNTIDKMSLNLAKGYDIADRILRQNRVLHYKVELPGVLLEKLAGGIYQARKQITIYTGEEHGNRKLKEWEDIIDEMVLSFVEQEVQPKPELIGEQDVCVKGSSFITYRCDRIYDKEIGRGFGCIYKDDTTIDPIADMQLSDVFYKKLVDTTKMQDINEEVIINIVKDSAEHDGLKNTNLERVIRHIKLHKNPKYGDKWQLILCALERAQCNCVIDNAKNDISGKIRLYETQTSYSKAAAEYNQLILNVQNQINKAGIKPLPDFCYGETERNRTLNVAKDWLQANNQWNKEHQNDDAFHIDRDIGINDGRVMVLASASAVAAYEANLCTVSDLAGLDIAKIELLVSQDVTQYCETEQTNISEFIDLDIDTIFDIVHAQEQQFGLSDLNFGIYNQSK